MKILDPILSRRSIRKYINKHVEDENVLAMLESARLAPSGSNTQPWNFVVVKSEELKKDIVDVSHKQKWMLKAPVFIVCVADIKTRIKDDEDIFIDENSSTPEVKLIIRDTAIAIEHLVLQAEAMGLSTCWVAYFEQKDIRPILEIPKDKYVVAIITVGYSNEKPKERPRKSLQEMIHMEKWGNVDI